jgi:hypothetical protein
MWTKLLAVVAVASLAACGPAGGPQVATAQGPATPPSGGPTSSAPAGDSDYDKALRYVRCMNENGENLPDPVEGQPLPLGTLGGGPFTGVTPAYLACKKYLPATWPVKLDPKEIARSAKFDECMRQKGFPLAEPDANGVVIEPGDITTITHPPGYDGAVDSCRYLVDDAANNQ